MGTAVSGQIAQATQSYIDHDKAAAQSLVTHDQSINGNEVDLEKQALTLMTLQQPVADDFRAVVSILKASADLERIGDHATSIASETIRVKGSHRNQSVEVKIASLSQQIRDMLTTALTAFNANDATQAEKKLPNKTNQLMINLTKFETPLQLPCSKTRKLQRLVQVIYSSLNYSSELVIELSILPKNWYTTRLVKLSN